jgi:2-dehydro-3-deoxyphosphooctonate aldolase (KDO 8-P synthase)
MGSSLTFFFDKSAPFLIAGPCVLEDPGMALEVGQECKRIASRHGIPYVFKTSYDKANRSSLKGFRGPGLGRGLAAIARIKRSLGVPVLSDVHEVVQVAPAAEILDVLQVPAFLCRQTDLLTACGRSGKVVNIKKGQFAAPGDMKEAASKVKQTGNARVLLTERGVSFGYHNLVVDFTALPVLRSFGCPVIFDATHSVQEPGRKGHSSGGRAEYAPALARAAAAVGVDGYFFEVHPQPARALSDGSSMVALKDFESVVADLLAHDRLRRKSKAKP